MNRDMLTTAHRRFLTAVSKLQDVNPFLAGMLIYEREALGEEAEQEEPTWSMIASDPDKVRANTWKIVARLKPMLAAIRAVLAERANAHGPADLTLYEDGLLYYFYYSFYERLLAATFHKPGKDRARWAFYGEFVQEWNHFFAIPGVALPSGHQAKHTFACYYQIVRAFHHIFGQIIGNSPPAAQLRASVWQSVFTHDIRRYRRTLYARMNEFATLITGPSGTGKELVARSIALSRYVPFDDNRMVFAEDLTDLFFPINIAALPGTLVESELFGHKRGSFTGAVQDKRGWLEQCPPLGAVFLDEIGDLDPEIQVKLLRVIETRSFHSLGESHAQAHRFEGKLMAATNRDLGMAIRKRKFREDLYYRLCSDQIVTPSLRRQIDESPEVMQDLVLFMARRVAGEEAQTLAEQAREWIQKNVDAAYGWPGNYRELEQCVRNILIRNEYQTARLAQPATTRDVFAEARAGTMTANELLSRYCKLVYEMTGSYEETARRLDIDRRTVKAKVTV